MQAYLKTVDRIQNAEYGERWKKLFDETPNAAVNADRVIFICDTCRYWEKGVDVSIYAPDPETAHAMESGKKEKQEAEDVIPWDVRDGYHLVERYVPDCPRCGNPMRIATNQDYRTLLCPDCGGRCKKGVKIIWD